MLNPQEFLFMAQQYGVYSTLLMHWEGAEGSNTTQPKQPPFVFLLN